MAAPDPDPVAAWAASFRGARPRARPTGRSPSDPPRWSGAGHDVRDPRGVGALLGDLVRGGTGSGPAEPGSDGADRAGAQQAGAEPDRTDAGGAAGGPAGVRAAGTAGSRWRDGLLLGRLSLGWPALAGPEAAQHTRPTGLSEGVLVVEADTPAWATSVRLRVPEVLALVRSAVGEGAVRAVEVRASGRAAAAAPATPARPWRRRPPRRRA